MRKRGSLAIETAFINARPTLYAYGASLWGRRARKESGSLRTGVTLRIARGWVPQLEVREWLGFAVYTLLITVNRCLSRSLSGV